MMRAIVAPALAAAAFTLVMTGCATGGGPVATPAGPAADAQLRTPEEIATAATLLRLEDRREYDPAALALAAQAPGAEVRRRAALAAGRIRDRRALPLLRGLLGDADTAVAAVAAFALGHLGDTTAVPALTPWLDPAQAVARPTVVAAAAEALGKVPTAAGRDAVRDFLLHAPATRPGEAVGAALLAGWRFREPVEPATVARWLSHPDAEVRWRAAYALARRPMARGTEALAPLAGDPDARVRSFVARALTAAPADSTPLGAARAREILLRLTGDADRGVRINAIRALGTHTTADAAAVLVRLLGDTDAQVALTAAESLGRQGTKAAAATEPLRALALDAAAPIGVRSAALSALGEVASADAVATASRLVLDPSWRMRAAAGRALAAAGQEGRLAVETPLRDADPRVVAAVVVGSVAAAGDSALRIRDLLVDALGHPDVGVRTAALGGFARLADPATLPLLLDAFARAQADTLNDAALAALDALGALKSEAAARSFLARFPRSADALVRLRAVTAFGDSAVVRAWGPALPLETGRTMDDYLRVVRERVVPALSGARSRVRITTNRGDIVAELFAADAPLTVASFLTLARAGYFDAQEWPRVVPNFVIQGGDPRGDTSGGPGYTIRDEINRHPYERGTVGMALSGPDTGGSQFFITHSPHPHLDGGYTVFGRVVEGMDVVDAILQGDRIIRVNELR